MSWNEGSRVPASTAPGLKPRPGRERALSRCTCSPHCPAPCTCSPRPPPTCTRSPVPPRAHAHAHPARQALRVTLFCARKGAESKEKLAVAVTVAPRPPSAICGVLSTPLPSQEGAVAAGLSRGCGSGPKPSQWNVGSSPQDPAPELGKKAELEQRRLWHRVYPAGCREERARLWVSPFLPLPASLVSLG